MWKCMLVNGIKYPLLCRWYDSQISLESVPTHRMNSHYEKFVFLLICAREKCIQRKVNQIVYYKNEGNQFVHNQIDKHAFAYPNSPAVQSKNQTSGYIDTYLIMLFVAIDTSSIIFVSLCKRKSFLRSWIFLSRSKEDGNGTQLGSFPGWPLDYASNPLPFSCTR